MRLTLPFILLIIFSFFPSKTLSQSCPQGDANKDCKVDGVDYVVWLNNFNKQVSGPQNGDFDNNGFVDGVDYVIWLNNYGNNEATNSPTAGHTITLTPSNISLTPNLNPPVGDGMWISKDELSQLSMSGIAWDSLRSAAYSSWSSPNLVNQNNREGTNVLAGALVYLRSGDSSLRTKTRDTIISAKRTMDESAEWQTISGALSLGRQLGGYVIAADMIDLKSYDSTADNEFRSWLRTIKTANVGTHGRWRNLKFTCENAAANWSGFACASHIAASIYLGDTSEVQREANIIRAWMGERQYYPPDAPGNNGYFQRSGPYDTTWDCNTSSWTAVNPACNRLGINLDGVVVEDAARGGNCCTLQGAGIGYSWEVLQGVFVSTELLYRTGKFGNPYTWSNQALKRTMDFMQRSGWGISSVAEFVPWIANKRYGTNYRTNPATTGRIMSWTDWTHQ